MRPPKLDRGGGRWNGRRDECHGIRHRARCQQKLHSCNKTNASPPFVAPLPRKCQLLHLLLRCRLSLCPCAPLVVAVFFLPPNAHMCISSCCHLPSASQCTAASIQLLLRASHSGWVLCSLSSHVFRMCHRLACIIHRLSDSPYLHIRLPFSSGPEQDVVVASGCNGSSSRRLECGI